MVASGPSCFPVLGCPLQPSHDIPELIEIAVFDVNRSAATAMIDRDSETKRIRYMFFHCYGVGVLLV